MAEDDDDVGFGGFMFSSSSHSISGPGFSAINTTTMVAAAANDDDDWGDFINYGSNISRIESLPVNDLHSDPFPKSPRPSVPDSAPGRVESGKTQWDKPTGALPLSIFGEEENEDEGSGAVDAGLNGVSSSFSFPKKDGNLKGKGSDIHDLIGDFYKHNEKANEPNGFRSVVDVKQVIDLNPKVDTWNWNGLNSALSGLGPKVVTLALGGNGDASVKKEEHLGSNGYAFGMESKEVNLGSNESGLSQTGLNLDSNAGNSDLADENDDDGWECKAAEPKAETAVGNLKVEGQEQENPKAAEFNFRFGSGVNDSSEFFSTSDEIANKPGKTLGSDHMPWAFKDATSGNGSETQEEPKVADASSSGIEDFSFGNHIQGSKDTSKNPKGALPLSIFGDAEIETEDTWRCEDISIKHNTPRAGIKDTHSNISINDLISSLYSQADKKAPLNQISNPSENELSSQTVVGSDLANGGEDFDDSWEFKDAVSGTRGKNQNSPLDFGDSYEKYSTKIELNDYMDLYSKLTHLAISII